ncbi:MAG: DUF3097 domain-containing protein [Actinomycetia bacterium]|nr:DUF3097 domain-containing protein [Actinomycetes bacterium]
MTRNESWTDRDILAPSTPVEYPIVEVAEGTRLVDRKTRFLGVVVEFVPGDHVVLADANGQRRSFPAHDGAMLHRGIRVALREPSAAPQGPVRITASGSIDAGPHPARVAVGSRIWVEGIHDAELVEKIWGDDLRVEGIVVEPLHGADDLAGAVDEFRPGPDRRLGVLLDHLVDGSKETRIAARVAHPDVLIRGHPYVDIWQAIKPSTIGIEVWPKVPRSMPWKEGIIARLGSDLDPGPFWGRVLDSVSSYRDLETPLVNAVEQLIDFVTVLDEQGL